MLYLLEFIQQLPQSVDNKSAHVRYSKHVHKWVLCISLCLPSIHSPSCSHSGFFQCGSDHITHQLNNLPDKFSEVLPSPTALFHSSPYIPALAFLAPNTQTATSYSSHTRISPASDTSGRLFLCVKCYSPFFDS